jgi:hypothetical protein
MLLNKFLYAGIFIFISFIPYHVGFNDEDLNKLDMFKDEICSYNGEPVPITRYNNKTG